jgi:uncharacterized protein YdeI (YjbR/CyaY-like superfamily)
LITERARDARAEVMAEIHRVNKIKEEKDEAYLKHVEEVKAEGYEVEEEDDPTKLSSIPNQLYKR